ncbi:MAG: TVP38/TMEM64 family protein [Myxococcales bacterium]|nr:TVP38/TMEM64 family protein [Myxococcales bacterium]
MISNRIVKALFTGIWALAMAAACWGWFRSGLEFRDVPELLDAWLSQFGLGRAALIYVVLYTIRPLVLFPATLLTIASGMLFGPWLGILFTIIGENASANFAFWIARWLGRSWVDDREEGRIRAWDDKIRKNALTSVLLMRLLYVPFDAVNYGCGLTSMRQRDFCIGTFLGILPALVSFVLLGGAGAAGVENRMLLFGSAVFFFVIGLIVAKLLKRVSPEQEAS